jgi:hypothetical protein
MFQTPLQIAAHLLTIVVTVLVFLRPAPGARSVAIASLVAYVATPLVQNRVDYESPQWGILGVDAALLVFITWVLMRERALWLQVTWGAMALTTLLHVAKALDPTLLARGYIGALHVVYLAFLAGLVLSLLPSAQRPRAPGSAAGV